MSDPAILYLQQAISRAEAARAELDIEVKGLRLALARLQQDPTQPGEEPSPPVVVEAPVSAEISEWRSMSRTDAVERVLAEAGGELHRKDVTTRLAERGRTGDTIDAVSAALAYMARGDNPRVESLGHGRWRLKSGAPHPAPVTNDAWWPSSWPGPSNASGSDPSEEVVDSQL